GGVDAKLLTVVARVGEVRGQRLLAYRDVAAIEWPERGGLTGHWVREELDFHAADGDWRADVRGRLTAGGGLLDALGDRGGLLGSIEEGRVDPGPHVRGVGEVQHAADRGDDDQHPGGCRQRDPVPQRHGASRST